MTQFGMPVPGYQEFMRSILEILSDGQDRNVRDVYSQPADRLGLTDADRDELIPSGTQRLLDNRAGWAKTYLVKAALLESPRRAVVRITERGRQALQGGERIDSRFLRRFAEFVEFQQRGDETTESNPEVQKSRDPTATVERTPEELIETGYRQV